jgi:imidazoleglycerol phosphate dehydratase HisB
VQVVRETAETYVSVSVDFSKHDPGNYHFNVSSSIQTAGLPNLLELFAEEAGFTIQLSFNAKMLNSSHVLLEDTGLVLGMALKEILILRMESYGVNGAGSSIKTVHDFHTQPVRVGVSVEGRKFLRILPFNDSIDEIKKKFLIGKNVCGDLFSEDLDDFLDGLAGGLGCSIMVHVKELLSPEEGWNMIFKHLGKAFKEVFSENTYRKGVPPGVKATLN